MASLYLLKCMDSHSALMAEGPIIRDLSFMCCRILLPNLSERLPVFDGKVLAILVQCQFVVFSIKIIAKAAGKK